MTETETPDPDEIQPDEAPDDEGDESDSPEIAPSEDE